VRGERRRPPIRPAGRGRVAGGGRGRGSPRPTQRARGGRCRRLQPPRVPAPGCLLHAYTHPPPACDDKTPAGSAWRRAARSCKMGRGASCMMCGAMCGAGSSMMVARWKEPCRASPQTRAAHRHGMVGQNGTTRHAPFLIVENVLGFGVESSMTTVTRHLSRTWRPAPARRGAERKSRVEGPARGSPAPRLAPLVQSTGACARLHLLTGVRQL